MHITKIFLDHIFRKGLLAVGILILLDLLVYFFYSDTVLFDVFLVTREQTPLTWVSVIILFFIGLTCYSMYQKQPSRVWYWMTVLFFFFSMDDAIFFHERMSGFVSARIAFFEVVPTYIWSVIYMPLLLFAVSSLILKLWRHATDHAKKHIIVAVLLLGSALFLDAVDGYVQKHDDIVFCFDAACQLFVEHVIRMIEEVMEVIAIGILAYYLGLYYLVSKS